jgi:hypothetical protein
VSDAIGGTAWQDRMEQPGTWHPTKVLSSGFLVRQEGELPHVWQDARLTMARNRHFFKVCRLFLTLVRKAACTIAGEAKPRLVYSVFLISVTLNRKSTDLADWFSIVGAWS